MQKKPGTTTLNEDIDGELGHDNSNEAGGPLLKTKKDPFSHQRVCPTIGLIRGSNRPSRNA
jgi:hypothetical protein